MTGLSGPSYNQYGDFSVQGSPTITSISAQITFNSVASATNGYASFFNMVNARLADGTSVYIGLHEPGENFSTPAGVYPASLGGTADMAIFSNTSAAPTAVMNPMNGSNITSFVDGGQPSVRMWNTGVSLVAGAVYTVSMTIQGSTLIGTVTDSSGHVLEIGYFSGLTAGETSFENFVNPGHEFTMSNISPSQEPSDDVIISNVAFNGSTVNVSDTTSVTGPMSGQDQSAVGNAIGTQCTREIGGDYMETASGANGYNTVHLAGTAMTIIGGNSQSALQLNATYHNLTSEHITTVPILDLNGQNGIMTTAEYSAFTTFLNGSKGVTLTTAGTINLNASVSIYDLAAGNNTIDINSTNPNNVQIVGASSGTNTVVLDGSLSSYSFAINANGSTTITDQTSGRDGSIIISNVQDLTVAGGTTMTLANAIANGTVTTPVGMFVTQSGTGNYNAASSAALGSNLGTITPPTGTNAAIGFQSAVFDGGYNAVVLSGPRADYAIQINASGITTIQDIGVGDAAYGQTVTVSGESFIIFNGANLSLSSTNSAASMITVPGSTTTVLDYPNDLYYVLNPANAQLAQFYNAVLPWEPQPNTGGLEYWMGQLAQGMSLTAIAQSFINTSYFQQTFGDPGTTHAQHVTYVELLYSHILGMNLGANEAGVLYWADAMDNGMSGATALISFTNATATASTINAMSGSAAGSGIGWLIDPSITGGYADPGAQISAQTVLTQAATNHFYNLSLIDPTSVTASGVSANGITLTPGAVQVAGTAAGGTVVALSPSFAQATITGSGYTIHDGVGSDSITITGANNIVYLGSATTDTLNLAFGTNSSVAGFTPGHGSVLAVSGTVNETAVSLLNGTTTAVHGSNLSFGTASAATAIIVNIGNINDGSATSVATAANAAYVVADVNGNAATGALGEHVTFIGTDSGGDTEIWAFRAPLSTVTVNGHAVQVPISGADSSGTHSVTASEITLIATLIGVSANNLTAADLG